MYYTIVLYYQLNIPNITSYIKIINYNCHYLHFSSSFIQTLPNNTVHNCFDTRITIMNACKENEIYNNTYCAFTLFS